MRLLMNRDPAVMVCTTGKAEVESDVPEKLRRAYIVAPAVRDKLLNRNNDDLLIANPDDCANMTNHLSSNGNYLAMPSVWSGYRSVLVSDGNGGLYRIKGCSLNPFNPEVQQLGRKENQVFGGQPRFAAQFEKKMSDRFNKALREEGIKPVMECKGYWHYPTRVEGHPYSASIVKVEGDTRLDEFMFLLENFINQRFKLKQESGNIETTEEGNKLWRNVDSLYYDIGFHVGGLKRLMDRNNQTWSADGNRSNAHVGNIVLYNGTDKVKIGLVDFDASCDTEDFSVSKIRAMQKREYDTIVNSAMGGPISPRQIMSRFFNYNNEGKPIGMIMGNFRERFVEGFRHGYDIASRSGHKEIGSWSAIDFARFLEIFDALRSDIPLTPQPASVFPSIFDDYREEKKDRIDDLYGILGRNSLYQKDLSRKDHLEKIIERDKYDKYSLSNSIIYPSSSSLISYLGLGKPKERKKGSSIFNNTIYKI